MKSLATAVALAVVFALAGSANAAEPVKGQISDSQLSALGLGGMEVVSDVQASTVRGKFLNFYFVQNNTFVGQVNNVVIYGPVKFGGITQVNVKRHGRH